MYKRVKLIFIFLISTNLMFGQIFHAFHLNDTVDIKNKRATEIIEELKIGNSTIKYIKRLNHKNQIISDERYDNSGNFIAKFMYSYDSITNLKTKETKEFVNKSGSHYFNTVKYEYNNEGYLTKIVFLTENGAISQIVRVTNNEKGYPLKLEEFTESGVLIGTEAANYIDNENKVTYDHMDQNGAIIYSSFFTLDYSKEKSYSKPGFEYNEMGDLVKTPDGFIKIIYDQYGNWISSKIFRKIDGASKLTQELTRTIKYIE